MQMQTAIESASSPLPNYVRARKSSKQGKAELGAQHTSQPQESVCLLIETVLTNCPAVPS